MGIFNTEYKNGKYPMYLTGRGSLIGAATLFQQYFRTGTTKRTLGYSNRKPDEILRADIVWTPPPDEKVHLKEAQLRGK